MKFKTIKEGKNMSRMDIITFVCLLVGTLLCLIGTYRYISKSLITVQSKQSPSLQQLIGDLRRQLLEAENARRSSGESALFKVGKCDVEVNVVVKNSDTTKGSFSYEVITAERANEYSVEQIQKITLHLDAVEQRQVAIPPSDPSSIK